MRDIEISRPKFEDIKLINEFFEIVIRDTFERNGIEEFCLDSGYKSAQEIWINKFGNPEYHLQDYWGEGADHMIWRIKLC